MRTLALLCLWLAAARAGWLDRVVQYRKTNFIKDVQDTLPAIEMHARIEAAPPGFEDSKDWDFDSVMRLLKMLRQSETGRRVHQALRRTMISRPYRRIYLSYLDSYKYFPNIHKDNYYEDTDMESVELLFETTPHAKVLNDNDVIIVSNPVEARLPSTKISVKMLRAILEERAFAARIMPPTTIKDIEWIPMENTTGPAGNATTQAGGSNDTTVDGGNSTAEGSSTVEGGNSTVADGNTTVADGNTTVADGNTTVADGNTTVADGNTTVAEGNTTVPDGNTTSAEKQPGLRKNLDTRGGQDRHVKKDQHVQRMDESKKKQHTDVHHRQQHSNRYKPSMRKHGRGLRSMRHDMPQTRPKPQPWFKNYR